MERNRIVCADAAQWLATLPEGSIDMALTSPPYDNLREYNGFVFDFEAIAAGLYRVLKPGGVLVWVVGDATIDGCETLTSMRQALHFVDVVGFRMHDTMIYRKAGTAPPHKLNRYAGVFEYMFVLTRGEPKASNVITFKRSSGLKKRSRRQRDGTLRTDISGNGGAAFPNVWEFRVGAFNRDEITEHPAIFPEALAERHVLTWSNVGDIVLDPFMGSGTTAIVARRLGRDYIGCDISAEYVALAEKRLAKPYTKQMFLD